MKKQLVISLSVVSLVLGILLALGVRTQLTYTPVLPTTNPRELSTLFKDLQETNKKLREEIKVLRNQLTDYEQKLASGKGAIQALNEQLQSLKILSGLTAVMGPGVVVTVADSGYKAPIPELQNLYIVHDDDLLHIVNELKGAGAEAIAINGQRLSFFSVIRCVGNVIQVNETPIASPYKIEAIGDPEVLESGLKIPGGILDALTNAGLKVSIKKVEQIVLPPYTGASKSSMRFAQPVGGP
ncbi:DUF881 domain-containing protein [bacterium]|nr:DUF881 domain-containing protein [bacterium]